ncbi:MAG: hypothetical protein R2911_13990 [Caldilineaceae bacterium]
MYARRFTVGDFALFAAYIWPVTIWIRTLGVTIADYRQGGVSIGRMQMLMQGAEPAQLVEHGPIYEGRTAGAAPLCSKRRRIG